jgi:pseudaminic acid cytidylyltransferase
VRLCVIPARGGSKRIPRKNIKPFFGKPMLAYPVEAALASGLFDDVIVSTEDDEIAAVAKQYGAKVPFKRPAELAEDMTPTRPVLLHAMDWYESQGQSVEALSYIYPASPFVTSALLQQAYQAWSDSGLDYCMAVCEFPSNPFRALTLDEQGKLTSIFPQYRATRTQDLSPAFYDAGMFNFCKPEALKGKVPVHSPATLPFVLPRNLAHDIDNEEDWQLAEAFYQLEQANKLSCV